MHSGIGEQLRRGDRLSRLYRLNTQMPHRDQENILIVFVKYPEPGKVKTRIARHLGGHRAAEIYSNMAKSVVEKVCKPDAYGTVIYFDPPDRERDVRAWLGIEKIAYEPQSPGTIGDRMSDAFQRVFSRGALKAVLIGTDVPGITEDTVRSAFRLLEEADVVLGPAEDGGYYLMGLKHWEPTLFENIEWGTDTVFNRTLDRIIMRNLAHKSLGTLKDVDTIDDIGPGLPAPPDTE